MEETVKKRSGNISSSQKESLVEFVAEHPKLRTGKFDATFTFKDSGRLWTECAVILNGIPGSQKDWKSWRKVRYKCNKKKFKYWIFSTFTFNSVGMI